MVNAHCLALQLMISVEHTRFYPPEQKGECSIATITWTSLFGQILENVLA